MTEEALPREALSAALSRTLETLPQAALESFAQRHKLLTGGYRPGGNPALLRQLVLQKLRSLETHYDPDLAIFLRTHAPLPRFFAALTEAVLQAHLRTFFVRFGKAETLLACLADEREAIRSKAMAKLEEHGAELPSEAEAQHPLTRLFAPVAAAEPGTAANQRTRETMADLRAKLDAAEKEARRARREAEEAARTLARNHKAELATAHFAVQELQSRIDRLQAELARREASEKTRVAALLAAKQIHLFHQWLAPACKLEALTEQNLAAPLLDRAEALLKQQAQFDRASARRAEAEAQLDALEQTLARVDAALRTANVRLPALLAVRDELVQACSALRTELTPAQDEPPLAAELRARLNAANQGDYEDALALLELSKRLHLLPEPTLKNLRQIFHQRAASWALEVSDKDREAQAAENSPIERRNQALTAALRGEAPLLLFCDGHNILNGLGRYKQRRGTALTHEDARSRLERDLVILLRSLPLVHAHLVWDGPQTTSHAPADNLTVHYSGGTGEHRADRFILDLLAFYKTEAESIPKTLVTDDQGFAGEARRLGAAVCPLHDFEAFLNVSLR